MSTVHRMNHAQRTPASDGTPLTCLTVWHNAPNFADSWLFCRPQFQLFNFLWWRATSEVLPSNMFSLAGYWWLTCLWSVNHKDNALLYESYPESSKEKYSEWLSRPEQCCTWNEETTKWSARSSVSWWYVKTRQLLRRDVLVKFRFWFRSRSLEVKYSSLHLERNLDSLTVLTGLKHAMNMLLREGGKWEEGRGIWDPVISYLYQSHAIIAAHSFARCPSRKRFAIIFWRTLCCIYSLCPLQWHQEWT